MLCFFGLIGRIRAIWPEVVYKSVEIESKKAERFGFSAARPSLEEWKNKAPSGPLNKTRSEDAAGARRKKPQAGNLLEG